MYSHANVCASEVETRTSIFFIPLKLTAEFLFDEIAVDSGAHESLNPVLKFLVLVPHTSCGISQSFQNIICSMFIRVQCQHTCVVCLLKTHI